MDTQAEPGTTDEQKKPDAESGGEPAGPGAAAQPYRSRLAWENYLRCFFILAVVFTVGLLAWRPGLLRFSLILSLANPSRGESLAWTPDADPVALPPRITRALSPDEWRLEPVRSAGWTGNRPRARQDGSPGEGLSQSRWRRFSTNPWRWNDDSFQARNTRKPSELLPIQKPATEYRAGNQLIWPEGSSDGLTASLSAPRLEGAPPLLPSQSGAQNAGLPGAPALPSLPGTATQPPPPSLPSLPPPVSAQDGMRTLPEAGAVRLPSSTIAANDADATTATAKPEETSNEPQEAVDWKNTEITGPIPGAYLTIYPKLKFIGLCVPGQGYVRKYNQVGVPSNPEGEKMSGRDGRTPYGRYYIADRRRDGDGPRMYLSWPSPDDAKRIGLDTGKQAEIEHAWRGKRLPPQDTAAGGDVGLNGLRNWVETTDGGFTLEAPHMEEIFTALPDGAWVFIQP